MLYQKWNFQKKRLSHRNENRNKMKYKYTEQIYNNCDAIMHKMKESIEKISDIECKTLNDNI